MSILTETRPSPARAGDQGGIQPSGQSSPTCLEGFLVRGGKHPLSSEVPGPPRPPLQGSGPGRGHTHVTTVDGHEAFGEWVPEQTARSGPCPPLEGRMALRLHPPPPELHGQKP